MIEFNYENGKVFPVCKFRICNIDSTYGQYGAKSRRTLEVTLKTDGKNYYPLAESFKMTAYCPGSKSPGKEMCCKQNNLV